MRWGTGIIVSVPFLDAPLPLAFAHRGFAPDGAENSMVAFERAIRLGYRYLETDVRATADGVAVALHDARLDRTSDRRGEVERMTWDQVRRARIAGTASIPLLTEVLGTWPDARINLDVKTSRAIAPTIAAIRRTAALDRVCVASFSGIRVTAVRRALGPELCTALSPRAVLALRLAPPGRRPRRPGPARCAQVPVRIGGVPLVDARYVRAAHRVGLQIHVWTVNEPAEMIRLLDLGVDGLMTDRADVLRAVLRARGQWTGA